MFVNDIFLLLASDNSRLFKEKILREHIDNEDLREAIRLALDPQITFGIRKIPEYCSLDDEGDILNLYSPTSLSTSMKNLSALANREKTGNAAIEYLKNILTWSCYSDAEVIKRIIAKDLACGIQTTPNKIWPGLISEWPCMLASQSDAKLLSKIEFPAYYDLKYDGMRFNAVVKNHTVEFKSRNGKTLDFLGHMEREFIELARGKAVVYDGELWIDDGTGKPLERKTGNGILQRAQKGTMTKEQASTVRCSVWDRIPYVSFFASWDETPYSERKEAFLRDLYDGVKSPEYNYELIHEAESTWVPDMDCVQMLFKEQLDAGQEGGILKASDAPWENKRSKKQIKFKAELSADMLCVGWEYGTKKNANRVGNLLLESSDGVISCGCGSGPSDKERDEWTANPDLILGKIIEITYNARISDKNTGKQSLFLPIFQCIRSDKDVANSSDEIK